MKTSRNYHARSGRNLDRSERGGCIFRGDKECDARAYFCDRCNDAVAKGI